VESFNGKLRDELLRGEVFNSLREAQVLAGADRAVAPPLQHRAAAQRARIPSARARGGHREPSATPPSGPGRISAAARAALTFRPDHPMGAGQLRAVARVDSPFPPFNLSTR
jgi:hypothetical protein